MFCKVSQKSGLEYIKEEILKDHAFAAIITEPYDIRCYQLIDTAYSFLSPYMSIQDESKRIQQISMNLFGKQRFDLYNIKDKKVIWIPEFQTAYLRYRELQIDEDPLFEEYYTIRDKIAELNKQLRDTTVTKDEDVESFTIIIKALSLANATLETLESQIYPYLREKKLRIAGDKPLSWKEKKYLEEDQQKVIHTDADRLN